MLKRAITPARQAFTLVELMVVIGIIAVLMSILLPTVSRAREAAKTAVCQSQLRQLTTSWMNFSAANKGELVSANSDATGWVRAGNTEAEIKAGKLFKYVSDVNAYRCNSDPNRSNLRTYSINHYLNSSSYGGLPVVQFFRDIPNPSMTFVFIEEWDPRGYNLGSFVVYPPSSKKEVFVDFPATFHNNGCNLSFADGHVEYWRFDDPRTSALMGFNVSSPGNPDLARLQSVYGLP